MGDTFREGRKTKGVTNLPSTFRITFDVLRPAMSLAAHAALDED